MNLVELLTEELKQKNIVDKVLIARYIYIRLGQLFEYDPSFNVETKKRQKEIAAKRVNPFYVTDFNIVCFSWADLYCELLKIFRIEGKVVPSIGHDYVTYTIDNKDYFADLTIELKDICNIKFGFATEKNFPIIPISGSRKKDVEEWDKKIGYRTNMNPETVLEMLKKELQEQYPEKEDYYINVYKIIGYILNFPRENVTSTSGRKYIYHLLKYFLGEEYSVKTSTFYNIENDIYIQAYKLKLLDQKRFFVYQRKNNNYQFQEVQENNIKILARMKTLKSRYVQNVVA